MAGEGEGKQGEGVRWQRRKVGTENASVKLRLEKRSNRVKGKPALHATRYSSQVGQGPED